MSVAVPVVASVDGPNRIIYLLSGVTEWNPIDDIYPEVRRLRAIDPSLRQYFPFCEALELIDKGGGATTGRALRLLLGTRIVPFDEDAIQTITGELLSDEGISGTALVDTTGLTSTIRLNYQPPPATEVVTVGSGVAPPTASENASAVWDYVFGGLKARSWVHLIFSAVLAKVSGVTQYGTPGTLTFRNREDTQDAIEVANDGFGNRTSVTILNDPES